MKIKESYVIEIDFYNMQYDKTNKRLLGGYIDDEKAIHYEVRRGTKVICEEAFEYSQIENVMLPESIRKIGSKSFYSCERLKFIDLPSKLLRIGNEAFAFCKSVENVVIPSTVVEIGNMCFYKCSGIKSFKIDQNNANFIFENGIIYTKNMKKLVSVVETMIAKDIVVPEGVVEIMQGAFKKCDSLNTVHLPGSLEIIGNSAFEGCVKLDTINLPGSTKFIGDKCFKHTKINTLSIPKNVKHIGTGAFSACYELEKIEILRHNPVFASKNGVLYDMKMNCLLNYPAGKRDKEYVIDKNTTKIEESAFESCMYLEKVVIPEGITEVKKKTFRNCRVLKRVILPMGLKVIEGHAFESCCGLGNLRLPENIEEISTFAFGYCRNLRAIRIPKSLTYIGYSAFDFCDLIKFSVDKRNTKYKSYKGKLYEETKYEQPF